MATSLAQLLARPNATGSERSTTTTRTPLDPVVEAVYGLTEDFGQNAFAAYTRRRDPQLPDLGRVEAIREQDTWDALGSALRCILAQQGTQDVQQTVQTTIYHWRWAAAQIELKAHDQTLTPAQQVGTAAMGRAYAQAALALDDVARQFN